MSDAKKRLITVASHVQGLYQHFTRLINAHHHTSLTYHPCYNRLNLGVKPFNTQFSILNDVKRLQLCGNTSSSWYKVAIRTCPCPGKHCISSWWLMVSPPCGPSATNRMNCLLVALKRCHQDCFYFAPNVFCIVETGEILIVILLVSEDGTSLAALTNVILLIPFWHCTPLGQVIKCLNFWSWVFHHSLDRRVV